MGGKISVFVIMLLALTFIIPHQGTEPKKDLYDIQTHINIHNDGKRADLNINYAILGTDIRFSEKTQIGSKKYKSFLYNIEDLERGYYVSKLSYTIDGERHVKYREIII